MTIQEALEVGRAHHRESRLSEAEAIYRQVLAQEPNQAEALHLLGTLALQVGRVDVAAELLARVAQLLPTHADCHNNLGGALRRLGKLDEAIRAFQRAVALSPGSAEAQNNLGSALLDNGDEKAALPVLRRAAALAPESASIQFNLGNALKKNGHLEEAIACYRRSLELEPGNLSALNNLGNVLKNFERLDEAIELFQQALVIDPNYFFAHNNLGDAYRRQGRLVKAEACFRRTVQLSPDSAEAHWNLGIVLLTLGQFSEGWREYAWRTRIKSVDFIRKEFPRPQWDGQDLAGRTILLHTEQGFGDNIQFVRYLPMVKARGGRILFGCEPELVGLFRDQFDVDGWVLPGEDLPAFDVHCPLMNLPMVFGTTLQNIPAPIPYLRAKPAVEQQWRERLAGFAGLKVGLAWAGRPTHYNDQNRSMAPEELSPLGTAEGVCFFSLQKGTSAGGAPDGLRMVDWTSELADFSQTAGLIANLDLVISVDTAVAHLAGAMGKPVWVLVPFAPDWRWMVDRADSPWYPTMRLFRQPAAQDWRNPVREMLQSLEVSAISRGTQ